MRSPLAQLAAEARAATGLTQRDFAGLIGTHHTTVAYWESEKKTPNKASVALLRLIRANPSFCIDLLKQPLA